MNLVKKITSANSAIARLKDLPLLFIRLILAYGFFGPATMKWKDIHAIADWFGEMKMPFPLLSAYLSASFEALGVLLLVLGLGTRIIALPLIFLLVVAIKTVHWSNGFEAGSNGYEIPLYYIIMLFTLFIYGSGKFSLDRLLMRGGRREKSSILYRTE